MTLREMAAEGRTVIFISHKLHEVTAGRRPGDGAARRPLARARWRRRVDDTLARGAHGRTRDRAPRRGGGTTSFRAGRAVLELDRSRRPVIAVSRLSAVSRSTCGPARSSRRRRRRERAAGACRDDRRHPPAAEGSFASPGRTLHGGDRARRSPRGSPIVPEDRLGHGCRARAQHRREPRAQVVPRPLRCRAARCSYSAAIRAGARRADRPIPIAAPGPASPRAALGRKPAEGRDGARVLRLAAPARSPPRRRAGSTSGRSRPCAPTSAMPLTATPRCSSSARTWRRFRCVAIICSASSTVMPST